MCGQAGDQDQCSAPGQVRVSSGLSEGNCPAAGPTPERAGGHSMHARDRNGVEAEWRLLAGSLVEAAIQPLLKSSPIASAIQVRVSDSSSSDSC